jgi:hypothetical protein
VTLKLIFLYKWLFKDFKTLFAHIFLITEKAKGKGTKAGESRPSPFSLAFSRSVALLPYFFEDF